jgi:hypothetical protein
MNSPLESGIIQSSSVEIDLSTEKVPEPLNAHRVNERYYGLATFSSERPYMVTYGLSACKCLILYDKGAKTGLIAHISLVQDLGAVIDTCLSALNGNYLQAKVYLIEGSASATRESPSWLKTAPPYWPSTEQLLEELNRRNVRNILLDSNRENSGLPRGVVLDLESGEVKELDNTNGWTWSKEQDVTLNRHLE